MESSSGQIFSVSSYMDGGNSCMYSAALDRVVGHVLVQKDGS